MMKREIKFRAWDGKAIIEIGMIDFDNGIGWDYYNFYDGYGGTSYPLSELMQYTGLKDKNGVEIYEGDILKFGNNNTSEVTFENGCFNVFDEPLGWDFDSEEVPIKALMSYCKVIGNIHENQELLDSN